jgi:parallel beta-helix repeat protein
VLLAHPARAATIHVPGDHKTIQAAIDAAKPGDTVLVAPGTYREDLRVGEKVTVRSAGNDDRGTVALKRAEGTIIEGGGVGAKGPAVVLAEGAVFDGFTVTKVGVFDQKEYDKHHATRGEDLPDERGAVGVGGEFPAVSVPGVTAVVRNCIVRDNGHPGIGCSGAVGRKNASVIASNVACRNMGGGIGVTDGAAPTVEGNHCFKNLRSGIGVRNAGGLVTKNECSENVRAGIGIREAARPAVRGNKCYRNRRAGIGSRMLGTAPLIADNDCYENGMAGIGCRDEATPVIWGNRCFKNTLAGIGCRDRARPLIVGNECYRNKEAGIGSQLGARPVIAGNECYENEAAGIGQSDAETLLIGNRVHHNKKAGIGFDECKSGRSVVVGNKVTDNELVAVGVHSGWKVVLTGNELTRDGGLPPLVMVFKGAEVDVIGNTLRGNGVAGVRTEGVVRVVNNTFECPALRKAGPPQLAIWGLPGSDILLAGNTINGWRHGLFVEKARVVASGNTVSGYSGVGLRINQPVGPAVAVGNVFRGEIEQSGVEVTGGDAITTDNRFEKVKPTPPKK